MGTTAATVALAYPGQGGYTPGVLARIARKFPEARPELARIRATWLAETGEDLSAVVADTNSDLAALTANSPGLSQIAMFATSVALHRALANRAPGDLMHIGHSFGEIAALTCAGAWSVEAGTRIVAARVRCLAALPARAAFAARAYPPAWADLPARAETVVCADIVAGGGPQFGSAMTAVSGSSERIELLVRAVDDPDLVVAGHNGPGQVVVSGPVPTIKRFEAVVGALGIRGVRIPSRYPFHSPMLAGAVPAFADEIRKIGWVPPRQPVYSSAAGRVYRADDDLAGMLAGHLVRPFDFGAAVRAQYAQGIRLFLECGGHRSLTSAIRRTLGAAGTSDWRAVAGDELAEPAAAALRALDGMRGDGRSDLAGALAARAPGNGAPGNGAPGHGAPGHGAPGNTAVHPAAPPSRGSVPGANGHVVPLDVSAIRDILRADLRADLWAIARQLFDELGHSVPPGRVAIAGDGNGNAAGKGNGYLHPH